FDLNLFGDDVRLARIDVKNIVVGVGSARVSDRATLIAALDAVPEGEPVRLVVARAGGEVELVLDPAQGAGE
ncbi:MAG: hypothetical protein AAFP22_17330, partial [Planctomycetota bacterium]